MAGTVTVNHEAKLWKSKISKGLNITPAAESHFAWTEQTDSEQACILFALIGPPKDIANPDAPAASEVGGSQMARTSPVYYRRKPTG